MNTLLHVIDDVGDIIECYALGFFGDAKLRLRALQARLINSEHDTMLIEPDLKTVIAKAHSDHSGGNIRTAISDLSRLSRRLWRCHWENNMN